MKYHILRDFGTSIPFREKSHNHFEDLHKLKLLTKFDVNLISVLGGVMSNVTDSSQTSQVNMKIYQELQIMTILKLVGEIFFKWIRSSSSMKNVTFHVKL